MATSPQNDPHELARGVRLVVRCAVLSDGTSPALDFLNELDLKDRARLMAKFQYMAEVGRISNPEHFKKLEGTDGLFEFKRFQIRLPCYFDSRDGLVLTHGLIKKRDRYPKDEIERAYHIRQQHEARVGCEHTPQTRKGKGR